MLSYRHSFHAGNFADVLKHLVVIECLQHLAKKDKPFDYIDTHSGAGLFDLSSEQAVKLYEYQNGIGKLIDLDWPELSAYQAAIKAYNQQKQLKFYPGSPLISLHFLRQQDRAWLYELHPEDVIYLQHNTERDKRVKVMNEDGLKGLLALLPPVSRRAFILIDPSYEIKSDYELVVQAIVKAHKKFATGTYALWYPVVDRQKIVQMERQLKSSGIRNIQRFELARVADTDERGMTSSGMIVINPPWQLMSTMQALLPKLVSVLGEDNNAFFKCDELVAE